MTIIGRYSPDTGATIRSFTCRHLEFYIKNRRRGFPVAGSRHLERNARQAHDQARHAQGNLGTSRGDADGCGRRGSWSYDHGRRSPQPEPRASLLRRSAGASLLCAGRFPLAGFRAVRLRRYSETEGFSPMVGGRAIAGPPAEGSKIFYSRRIVLKARHSLKAMSLTAAFNRRGTRRAGVIGMAGTQGGQCGPPPDDQAAAIGDQPAGDPPRQTGQMPDIATLPQIRADISEPGYSHRKEPIA